MTDLNKYLDLTVETQHGHLDKMLAAGKQGKWHAVKASIDYIVHELLPREGEKILEVGIGGAYTLYLLANQYPHASGISIIDEDVINAREHGLQAVQADMHDMAVIPDNSVDGLFCCHTLEHSPAPYIALREFERVLKADGWLVVVVPERDGLAGLKWRIGEFVKHLFCPSVETMIYLLRKAGFRLDWYREVPLWDERLAAPAYYHQVYCGCKGREKHQCRTEETPG